MASLVVDSFNLLSRIIPKILLLWICFPILFWKMFAGSWSLFFLLGTITSWTCFDGSGLRLVSHLFKLTLTPETGTFFLVCKYSGISIKRTHYKADTSIRRTVWRGTDCFAFRSDHLRKNLYKADISIKRTHFFAPMVSAL